MSRLAKEKIGRPSTLLCTSISNWQAFFNGLLRRALRSRGVLQAVMNLAMEQRNLKWKLLKKRLECWLFPLMVNTGDALGRDSWCRACGHVHQMGGDILSSRCWCPVSSEHELWERRYWPRWHQELCCWSSIPCLLCFSFSRLTAVTVSISTGMDSERVPNTELEPSLVVAWQVESDRSLAGFLFQRQNLARYAVRATASAVLCWKGLSGCGWG